MLVPPTWDKIAYASQLSRIWGRAAKVLGAADSIFIIGYSLPETDSFFRYLFALGTQGETRIKNLWVINPDEDGSVEEKFRGFIGRGIEKRLRFLKGEEGRFENAISVIASELDKG